MTFISTPNFGLMTFDGYASSEHYWVYQDAEDEWHCELVDTQSMTSAERGPIVPTARPIWLCGGRARTVDGETWTEGANVLSAFQYGAPVTTAIGGMLCTYYVGFTSTSVPGHSNLALTLSIYNISTKRRRDIPVVIEGWPTIRIDWMRHAYVEDSGVAHLALRDEFDVDGPTYYTRTEDLGRTWSAPTQCMPSTPLPWSGGAPLQTSNRRLESFRVFADGDRVAVFGRENWTEQQYIAVYDDERYAFLAGYWNEDHYVPYLPYDFIIATSADGGQTWSSPVRIKNDENQAPDGGGTYAWGGGDPRPSLDGTPQLPVHCNYALFNVGNDLYLAGQLMDLNKRMGGTPNPDHPNIISGSWATIPYGVENREAILVYRIPGWTGTPVREVVYRSDETHGRTVGNTAFNHLLVAAVDAARTEAAIVVPHIPSRTLYRYLDRNGWGRTSVGSFGDEVPWFLQMTGHYSVPWANCLGNYTYFF